MSRSRRTQQPRNSKSSNQSSNLQSFKIRKNIMNNNANQTNTAKADDGKDQNLKQNLKASLKAVREAIIALHVKIENETDEAKKAELVAEMKEMTAEIGLVFDGDAKAAEQQIHTENGMEEKKESIWKRTKAFIVNKFTITKVYVVEHKVAVGLTIVAIVAAVAALVLTRGRNANLAHGLTDTNVAVEIPADVTVAEATVDTNQSTAPSFFQKVGGLAIRGAVGAKDLLVQGAIATKDLAVKAANAVGGLFTKKSVTPYNVDMTATSVAV